MLELLTLVALLLLLQRRSVRQARQSTSRMMGPADDWEPEDVDAWLALIEPFPLPEPESRV